MPTPHLQVDICPEHVLKHTLDSLQLILRKPGVKKRPFMVRTEADVLTCARHIDTDALAPIFMTSSVTGGCGDWGPVAGTCRC